MAYYQTGTRIHLNKRKRKRDEYESSSESESEYEPKQKKRKLSHKYGAKYEKKLKPILKETSVLLENAKKNKFIEIGMVYNGSAYAMIQGDIGTKGIKKTRNFASKQQAFKAALQLLTVSCLFLFIFIKQYIFI